MVKKITGWLTLNGKKYYFDKEGKMMDASAPRPSETKTDELLNGLK